MGEEKLAPLEPLGQFLADGALDDARPCEPDERLRLGQVHVPEEREAGGNPAGGRVQEHADERQCFRLKSLECRYRLGHLHQAQDAFLHPGSAGGLKQDDGKPLTQRPFEQACDLLAHDAAHRATHECKEKGAPSDRPSVQVRTANFDGLFRVRGPARARQTLGIRASVDELERVRRLEIRVPFVEPALVEKQSSPAARVELVVAAAKRTHLEVGREGVRGKGFTAGVALAKYALSERLLVGGVAFRGFLFWPGHVWGHRVGAAGKVVETRLRRERTWEPFCRPVLVGLMTRVYPEELIGRTAPPAFREARALKMESDQVEVRARGRLGSVLRGKYRLDSVLGVGGMAVVYKAVHRNQAEFAVKMLHPELSLNDNIRGRFLREGYAANSVKHSGVVLVVDDDVAEDGAAFLVMELLSGLTADEAWSALGDKIPLDAACALAVELLDVLAAAHDKGILHRDIKPANVFITRDGVLKVLDFGIARVRDSMAGGSHATGTGMLLGTPAFMAPEQVIGKPTDIDTRVDLWAVGATVFNLVSGQMVHEAETGPQLMVKLATQPPRSLYAVLPDAPAPVAAVIDRALAFDKNQRWQTATEMQEALRSACTQCFGDFVPRTILARLVATAKPPAARPAAAAGSGARPPTPGPYQGTPAPGVAPTGAGARAVTGGLPISTSSGVYQDHASAGLPSSRKGLFGVVAGLAVLAGVGITLVVLHRSSPSSTLAASSASALSQPPAPSEVSKPSSPTKEIPTAVALVASSAPPPLETPHPEPAPAGTARHSGGSLAGHVSTARDAGPAREPTGGKANCSPPYTLDQNGEKHFKPECF